MSILTDFFPPFMFLKTVTPESVTSGPEDEEEQVELAEEMENEICRVWDMSTDEVMWMGSRF